MVLVDVLSSTVTSNEDPPGFDEQTEALIPIADSEPVSIAKAEHLWRLDKLQEARHIARHVVECAE